MCDIPWVQRCLTAVFGERLRRAEQIGETRRMGFSSAEIVVLGVDCADPGPDGAGALSGQLVAKRNERMVPLLTPDASEGERLRAERTDQSFVNEVHFFNAFGSAIAEHGCRVPRNYYCKVEQDCFVMFTEGLTQKAGWHQHIRFPPRLTRPVLRWLARFHAAFLPKACGGGGLPLKAEHVWEFGRHLALERRPASEIERIPQILSGIVGQFASQDPYFAEGGSGAAWAGALGEKLQRVTPEVGRQLGAAAAAEGRWTMVHGDYKAANIFIGEDPADGSDPPVAVIDWQWTGPGVGATDIIYLCATTLADEVVDDWESSVLRVYHSELSAALGGGEQRYPYGDLRREFALAAVDYFRWTLGARFDGCTPEKMARKAKEQDINTGEYQRSQRRFTWLFSTAEKLLAEL
eukprot:TRINITY_DN55467_c0_g1_i1.p1 TRINITY_DN55467_c0_g1~~TRINITY_DN55467_c0_g1_i1.p1  ORF type:complete len:437 (+),score=141.53 TRINITY_DN55467_c0_g1_i1:91-1311(+)